VLAAVLGSAGRVDGGGKHLEEGSESVTNGTSIEDLDPGVWYHIETVFGQPGAALSCSRVPPREIRRDSEPIGPIRCADAGTATPTVAPDRA